MLMKLSSALKSTKTATVLDMSFCLLTLPAVLTYFSAEQKADASEGTIYFRLALCLAFLFMSLSRLFRACVTAWPESRRLPSSPSWSMPAASWSPPFFPSSWITPTASVCSPRRISYKA